MGKKQSKKDTLGDLERYTAYEIIEGMAFEENRKKFSGMFVKAEHHDALLMKVKKLKRKNTELREALADD